MFGDDADSFTPLAPRTRAGGGRGGRGSEGASEKKGRGGRRSAREGVEEEKEEERGRAREAETDCNVGNFAPAPWPKVGGRRMDGGTKECEGKIGKERGN